MVGSSSMPNRYVDLQEDAIVTIFHGYTKQALRPYQSIIDLDEEVDMVWNAEEVRLSKAKDLVSRLPQYFRWPTK